MSEKKGTKPKSPSLKRKAATLEVPEDAVAPPYRVELNFKKKELVVYVTLHKIPDRYITLHVTAEEFFLHTLEYSKKFYLKFLYDDGATKVDPDRVQTEFAQGILKCTFPVIETVDNKTGAIIRKKQKQHHVPAQQAEPVQEALFASTRVPKNTSNNTNAPKKAAASSAEPKRSKEKTQESRELAKDVQMNLIEELSKKEEARARKMADHAEGKAAHLEEKDERKKLRKQKISRLQEESLKQVKKKKETEKNQLEKLARKQRVPK